MSQTFSWRKAAEFIAAERDQAKAVNAVLLAALNLLHDAAISADPAYAGTALCEAVERALAKAEGRA